VPFPDNCRSWCLPAGKYKFLGISCPVERDIVIVMGSDLAQLKKQNEQLQYQLDAIVSRLHGLEKLEKQVQRLNDIEEIKVLMNKFGITVSASWLISGYYMEKQLFQQVIPLYSTRDDVKSYCHGGVWVGSEGIKRLYVSNLPPNLF
jgi:hypothetical protein